MPIVLSYGSRGFDHEVNSDRSHGVLLALGVGVGSGIIELHRDLQ